MRVFLLYYDHNTGAREEWNTFYTPCEVFLDDLDRRARRAFLLAQDPTLRFHEDDLLICSNLSAPSLLS